MSRVVILEAGMRRMLSDPRGPVGRIIEEKAELIFQHARANIQSTFDSRTGDLEGSLKKVRFTREDGFHIAVGADAHHRGFPYARALELGQDPIGGGPLLAGNNQQTPVTDKAYMVPAVRQAGFRER